MNTPRFVQIHWLASYPSALLNRDDAGLAKRVPFGGAVRGRISSQCLKRHWRFAGEESHEDAKRHPFALQNLGLPMGERTREIVERLVVPAAMSATAASPARVTAVTEALIKRLYGPNGIDIKKRQALFFGRPEIEYLSRKCVEALEAESDKAAVELIEAFAKVEKENLAQMKLDAGLESALFGRMVTADRAADRDAAVHVAHALTVHSLERELDFVTVVDDLKKASLGDDSGGAGMFDAELTSGVYYGYCVVDVPLLVSNVGDDRAIAARVLEHFLHLIATVSPGAKKGSTAPYAYAEYLLVEAGSAQPRTLANAFRRPVALNGDVLDSAIEALSSHVQALDDAYGAAEWRCQVSPGGHGLQTAKRASIAEAATAVRQQVEA